MRQYGRRKAGALAPEIPSLVFRISNISEEVQFLEGFPGTFRNGAQRVFRNVDGQSRLFMQELIQTALTEHLPHIKRAVLVQDISPELLDEARSILKMRHGG